MEKVRILGIDIDNMTMDEVLEKTELYLKESNFRKIFTPNTEIVMLAKDDKELQDLINSADIVIADGIGLIHGSKIRKKPLKERVTGFDLSVELLEIANKEGYSIYFLGGEEGVAKDAAENSKKKYPNIRIAGYRNGFFPGTHTGKAGSLEEKEIIEEINESKADILFVGLGFPKQEIWISENEKYLETVKIAIGNGGTMDILSGRSKRAPEIYQKLGLEWLYRLVKEPSRIKRQILLPKFMLNVIFSKDSIE